MSPYLENISAKKHPLFIFAHGAGAPMDSDWMGQVTYNLNQKNISVARFEFPYMQERRKNGKKRPPNPLPKLIETWEEVLHYYQKKHSKIFIGGKSMGGRIGSIIADQHPIAGLICLGFPFHSPGKPPGKKMEHLETLKTSTLIIQGERDTLGNKEEILSYKLSKKIKLHFLEDGDHSFKPRKKSGFTLDEHLQSCSDIISEFIQKTVKKGH